MKQKHVIIQCVCSLHFLRPKNGGKYCVGRRMKFKSCNAEPCPKQKQGFRDEQCAHFDGKHFNINGLLPNVRWVPKYSGSKCIWDWSWGGHPAVWVRHKSHSCVTFPFLSFDERQVQTVLQSGWQHCLLSAPRQSGRWNSMWPGHE